MRLFAMLLLVVATCVPVIAETREERLEALKVQDALNSARIRELGGVPRADEARNAIRGEIYMLEDKANRLENVARLYTKTNDELRELQRKVEEGKPLVLEDFGKTAGKAAAEKGIEAILKNAVSKGAARATGVGGEVVEVLEHVIKSRIRSLDAAKVGDMVRREQAQVIDVLKLVSAIRQERNRRAISLAEVERLRAEQQKIMEEMAELNQPATKDAKLMRETDAKGDEAMRQEQLYDRVRLCDPATRKPKNQVAPAGTLAPITMGIEPSEQTACRQLEGPWHMDWQNARVPDVSFEIAYEPAANGAAVYTWSTAMGLKMRCTTEGGALNCLSHQPAPPDCPNLAMPAWQKHWEIAPAGDGSSLAGFWMPELAVVVREEGCIVKPSPLKLEFVFVMQPEGMNGEVSAK